MCKVLNLFRKKPGDDSSHTCYIDTVLLLATAFVIGVLIWAYFFGHL